MNKYPISLVLDQASVITGWVVIQHDPNVYVSYGITGSYINSGIVDGNAKLNLHGRLSVIVEDLTSLIITYNVDEIVLENIQSFVKRSAAANQAQAAVDYEIDRLIEKFKLKKYTVYPQTVKKFITGNGNASKQDVQKAVMNLWGNPKILDENHSDALSTGAYWLVNRDQIIAQPNIKKGRKQVV